MNAPVMGGSQEPEVVGKVLTLESGQMSLPLKGEAGVYVVQVENIVEPADLDTFESEQRSVTSRLSSRANSEVYNALKEKANVKDERSKYY